MFSRPPPSFQDFQLSKLYRSVLNKKNIYSYELSVYSKNKEYQSVVVKNVQEKKDIYIYLVPSWNHLIVFQHCLYCGGVTQFMSSNTADICRNRHNLAFAPLGIKGDRWRKEIGIVSFYIHVYI